MLTHAGHDALPCDATGISRIEQGTAHRLIRTKALAIREGWIPCVVQENRDSVIRINLTVTNTSGKDIAHQLIRAVQRAFHHVLGSVPPKKMRDELPIQNSGFCERTFCGSSVLVCIAAVAMERVCRIKARSGTCSNMLLGEFAFDSNPVIQREKNVNLGHASIEFSQSCDAFLKLSVRFASAEIKRAGVFLADYICENAEHAECLQRPENTLNECL